MPAAAAIVPLTALPLVAMPFLWLQGRLPLRRNTWLSTAYWSVFTAAMATAVAAVQIGGLVS